MGPDPDSQNLKVRDRKAGPTQLWSQAHTVSKNMDTQNSVMVRVALGVPRRKS